jgi:hypothetical protein
LSAAATSGLRVTLTLAPPMTPNARDQRPRSSGRKAAVSGPLHRVDTDTRPRVLPGLVTSIHHRRRCSVLYTMQALIAALRAFCNDWVQMLQSMFARRLCASACAARVCMAGCSKAPHPAMRQRSCPAPRVKGTLRRAAPALDTRLRARPHLPLACHRQTW